MPSEGDAAAGPDAPFGVGGPERTPVVSVLPAVVTVAGGLLLAMAAMARGGGADGVVFAGIVVVLTGVARAVGWFFRRYEVLGDRLVVHEGGIEHTQRVVPYQRIQQVDLRSTAVQRVLGLVSVRIGTAGGSEAAEVTVTGLRPPQAEQLRAFLLSARDRAREPDGGAGQHDAAVGPDGPPHDALPPHTAPPDLVLPVGRLALAGATGASIWLGIGALGAAALSALQAVGSTESQTVGIFERLASWSAVGLVLLGVGILLVLPLLGAAYSVVQYGNYRLRLDEGYVRVSYGMLAQRRLTLPMHRIHVVALNDNPVRRALGMRSVVVRSAAHGGGDSEATHGAGCTIPLLTVAECAWLLDALISADLPSLTRRPAAARARCVRRRVAGVGLLGVAATAAAAVAGSGAPTAVPTAVVSVALVALCVPWGRAVYRRGGHHLDGRTVWLGSGLLSHRLVAVPRGVVQSAACDESVFQRRAGLSSLRIDVAAGGETPHLRDMAAEVAAGVRRELTAGAPQAG